MLNKNKFIKEKIVIVGAGFHAECVIANILEEDIFEIFGLLDSSRTGMVGEFPILGKDDLLTLLKSQGVKYAFPGAVIGAKADTGVLERIFKKLFTAGLDIPNLVSSRACLRKEVKMGKGILVQPLSVIDVGASLGNGVVVNPHVLIGHHCKIDDYVVFAGGAVLNANISVGQRAFIGMGAQIFADIGPMSKIAPGTVVMESVPEGYIAFGNPARIIRRID